MNPPFHIRLSSDLLRRTDRTPFQKLLLAYLAFRIGRIGRTWHGQLKMAEELGVCERTIRNTVADLVALGDVEIVVHGRGRAKTNSYSLKQANIAGFSVPENRQKVVTKIGNSCLQKGKGKKKSVCGRTRTSFSSPSGNPKTASVEPSTAADFPPTIEAVAAYAESIGYALDADRFVDYYASTGWLIGKSVMRDWRAAVRNWQRRDGQGKVAEDNSNDPDEQDGKELLARAAAMRRGLGGGI